MNQNPNQNRRPTGSAQPNRQRPANGTGQRNPQQNPRQQQNYAGMTPEEIARREAYLRRRREEREAERQRQRDAERRARQREQARREAERKQAAKDFAGRLLVFGIILAVLLIIAGVLFAIFFNSAPDKPDDSGKMKYLFGGEEIRSIEMENALVDGQIYFCFNDLADYLGLSESGSAANMKFILPSAVSGDTAAGTGQEEYIIFTTDTARVVINGQQIQLDLPNILRGTEIWVSQKFITDYMNNLSCTYDEKKSTVTISRVKDEENSTEEQTVFLPVSFKLKSEETIAPIEEDPLIGDVTYNTGTEPSTSEDAPAALDLGFKTDLSAYEEYMNPTGDKRDAFLILVNTTNLITDEQLPTDLMDCKYTSIGRNTQQLSVYAGKALEALFQEMHAMEFYNMSVHSGYRSPSYQVTLFESYTNNEMANNPGITREQAEAIVLTYSTRPYTSEHHTGLAVDMDTLGTFSTDFAYTAEYAWLQENAWKFGFILRFPADKTDITTIQFEPWHYRFVGRYHAQKIHESGLCLEEYVAQLN